MPSLNNCQFIGHLGKDPEMRYTPAGKAVTDFSVAVSDNYKKDDQWVERTEWVNVVCWGKTAEYAASKLTKGELVYVQGKLQSRVWDKTDGTKGYKTELVADKVLPLEKKAKDVDVEPEDLPF